MRNIYNIISNDYGVMNSYRVETNETKAKINIFYVVMMIIGVLLVIYFIYYFDDLENKIIYF
jgi:hypothetical protein